jgi:hypothetical protein
LNPGVVELSPVALLQMAVDVVAVGVVHRVEVLAQGDGFAVVLAVGARDQLRLRRHLDQYSSHSCSMRLPARARQANPGADRLR